MRHYELVIVYSPRLTDEQLTEEVAKVTALLKGAGAETIEEERWGRRDIAYKLSRSKADQGIYVCLYYSLASSDANQKLVNALRITETALLYQVHKIEGKQRKFKGRIPSQDESGEESKAA